MNLKEASTSLRKLQECNNRINLDAYTAYITIVEETEPTEKPAKRIFKK